MSTYCIRLYIVRADVPVEVVQLLINCEIEISFIQRVYRIRKDRLRCILELFCVSLICQIRLRQNYAKWIFINDANVIVELHLYRKSSIIEAIAFLLN